MIGAADCIGPYRLTRELGGGGQATVYLADDPRLDRRIAVKVLSRRAGVDERRFRREAEAAARVNDPGICAVHDVGVDRGLLYIAMRYVEGRTLARWIAETAHPLGRTDLDHAMLLVERIARAAHKAHEAGVVHRDLKPGNIMVTADGDPVILDFGLAHDQASGVSLSLSGKVFGTPAYMTPEQIAGKSGGRDRRTDVYALGAILYECVTGRPPLAAPTRQGLYRAILEHDPADPRRGNPAIPFDLKVVLDKALSKEPDQRYATALDLAEDLRRIREHEPIVARPAGPAVRLQRWARRNPRLTTALAVLAVTLSLALAATTWQLGERRAALAESLRRYDMRAVPALLQSEADGDWPATARGIGAMDAWLAQATPRCDRIGAHRAYLGTLDEGAASAREREEVAALVDDLGELETRIDDVRARRRDAATLAARTLDAHADSWRAAIEAIADTRRNPQYRGLEVRPQVGLVPLGQDPDSRLFEFGHAQSGELPQRDPRTGRLVITEETCFVFVLIPAGAFDMGAEPPSETKPAGSPNVDPYAMPDMLPVHRVELDAFFMSKFEIDQAQWLRLTGRKGSVTTPAYLPQIKPIYSLLYPADGIKWDECRSRLARLGLALPTEAQWEYAARAGTTTTWWTGDDLSSLEGAAWYYGYGEPIGGPRPVGSFRPNPFGLHDFHGNAVEWTRDTYGAYTHPARPGDGERLVEPGPWIVVRDSGGFKDPISSTSARRSRRYHERGLGCRPVRSVEE